MTVLNVQIPIPDSHVLIEKSEYEELKSNEALGQYYTMKDLQRLTGKSDTWLYENLLNNPHRLERMKSFTHIPQGRGDKWLFKATGLREYLEDEFLEILRR